MDLELLKNIGLTEGEIHIYSVLLENGELPAKKVIEFTKLKKGDCYNKIYDLKAKGLIEEIEKDKIKHFRLEHPNKIKEFIQKELERISSTEKEIEGVFSDLVSKYNLNYNKPGVTFYEGLEAMNKVYDDILEVGKDYQVVISKRDKIYDEKVMPVNEKHIRQRVRRGIWVEGLSTFEEKKLARVKNDKKNFYKRQWVLTKDYNSPVQINIYGNKVSFMSFGKEFVSLIIDSPQISKAMKQLFNLAKIGAKVEFEKKK